MKAADILMMAGAALGVYLLLAKFGGGAAAASSAAADTGGVNYDGIFLPGWIPNSVVGLPDAYRSDTAALAGDTTDYNLIDRILKSGGKVWV